MIGRGLPTLGRWTELDPSHQTAGYTYAGDDPIKPQRSIGRMLSILWAEMSSRDAFAFLAAAAGIIGLFTGVDEVAGLVFGAIAFDAFLFGELCTHTSLCNG